MTPPKAAAKAKAQARATGTGAAGERVVFASPEHDHIYRELARPFTPAALKWKVQVNPKEQGKSALVVGYIDARLVAARLDHVVPLQWGDEYMAVVHSAIGSAEAAKAVLCALTVMGTTRVDVGLLKGEGNSEDEIRIKGGYSDALKRVAVKFGVGASVYAIPKMWVGASEGAVVKANGNKFRAYIDNPKAEKYLRDQYAAWLSSTGIALFGEPIDHGDVEGAQGDVDTGDATGGEAQAGGNEQQPEHGPEAGQKLQEALARALDYMHGFSNIEAAPIINALGEHYGYLPEPAARALAMYSAAVKNLAEPKGQPDPSPEGL